MSVWPFTAVHFKALPASFCNLDLSLAFSTASLKAASLSANNADEAGAESTGFAERACPNASVTISAAPQQATDNRLKESFIAALSLNGIKQVG